LIDLIDWVDLIDLIDWVDLLDLAADFEIG
jgi:hypothetical protein